MLPAKPELENAAGNASTQTAASGPGLSEYGASAPFAWVQARSRNSALPPRPTDSAIGPPPPASGSGSAVARGLTGFGGGFGAPSSSASGGGAGGFCFSAFSSPSP